MGSIQSSTAWKQIALIHYFSWRPREIVDIGLCRQSIRDFYPRLQPERQDAERSLMETSTHSPLMLKPHLPLLALLALLVISQPVQACTTLPRKAYGVILSPGPQAGLPWGGYHITVAGYSARHACRKNTNTGCYSCRNLLPLVRRIWRSEFRSTPWHLHEPISSLKNSAEGWRLNVKSTTLNRAISQLKRAGFQSLKGPKHANFPWHISLHASSKDRARDIVEDLESSDTPWHLWLAPECSKQCKEKGLGCPEWEMI